MKKDEQKKKNYQIGAMKRKLGIKKGEKTEPGEMIRRANEAKRMKEKVAIMGLI